MHSYIMNDRSYVSTPKRKRLGIRRMIRSTDVWREKYIANSTPLSQQIASSLLKIPERCESPALPCNQVEYLHDSGNNSVSSDIPGSPGIEDINDLENWESLISRNNVYPNTLSVLAENEISDEMFQSKLEMELTQNRDAVAVEELRQEIDNTFEAVNKSIVNHEKDSLFQTRDSFLLDLQTDNLVDDNNYVKKEDNAAKSGVLPQLVDHNSFYGLPMITKGLFQTYRNIDKLYDWQEECLNLDAIKNGKNLIYALPTSGGKTLVAEVLMLREVLNRKRNVLFILPFVAIVQEKIWALSPFALQLEFLVEEYAAGKGHLPPKKRRKKNSIYIATIEKGLALIRSLIELDRLQEIGLIVVDELHLIGEPGRGAALEILLTTVLFADKGIQIVGMSATIGNLSELAAFLGAQVFERQFRPVELVEYVKLGDTLHRPVPAARGRGVELVPHRQLAYNYSAAAAGLDPDRLGGLVSEVVPAASCLVFCPTKRNCENVAALLCKLQRREMTTHRAAERAALARALCAEGAGGELVRAVRCGLGYHHAGLAADERALLEHAFRAGVISVLCCTSTLAAGVNLPARRVIIRAPRVAREPLSLAAYRQMSGRAGRAGVCEAGESIIICPPRDWPELRDTLAGGLPPARSVLRPAASGLLLSGVALRLATTPRRLHRLMATTLLAVAPRDSSTNIEQECDEELRKLLESGVLEAAGGGAARGDTRLAVSSLGKAAIKGCLELGVARRLLQELQHAARALVLLGALHLLYLVVPQDAPAALRIDYRHYYTLYSNLDEEGMQTARVLGITESNAIRMMTGKPITNVPETVLCRFYLALMLHDLWKQMPVPVVADKYQVGRGTVQSVMCSAASFAAAAHRFCEELEPLWPFRALLLELAARLRHCAAPDLHQLMELPAVKKARALQLVRAGYKRIEDLAKASAEQLSSAVPHLSRTAASHLVSAARMMLIEKVENLRAEAEDVMEELK